MRIVISGSRGFIGTHLVNRLKSSKSFEIVEVDFETGFDLRDWDKMKSVTDFQLFIHLANKIFVPDSYTDPHNFYQTNFLTTLNALELCRINNAKLIFLSSYVYGNPNTLPIDENHSLQSFNPYSNSKIICEQLCKGYYDDFNVPLVVLRPFNLYGPGQNKNFLVPRIIEQIKSGKIELDDPRPKRDLLYIDDFIDLFEVIIKQGFEGFEIFNVGSGSSLSVEEVVNTILNLTKINAQVNFKNIYRQNEVLDTIANIDKINKYFNWLPGKSFKDGVRHWMANYEF